MLIQCKVGTIIFVVSQFAFQQQNTTPLHFALELCAGMSELYRGERKACFVCLESDKPMASTGCGCTSSWICRPCAEYFSASKTYARVDAAITHDEDAVRSEALNPLALSPRCSACRQDYTGKFKQFLQRETLQVLLRRKEFPMGRLYINPFYVLELLLDVSVTGVGEGMGFVIPDTPEALEALYERLFDDTVKSCKDHLMTNGDMMTEDSVELLMKVCTVEKNWLIRKAGFISEDLPKDDLERLGCVLCLRYTLAVDVAKVATEGLSQQLAELRRMFYYVECLHTQNVLVKTAASAKALIDALSYTLNHLLRLSMPGSAHDLQEVLAAKVGAYALHLNRILGADARYSDSQHFLESVLKWAKEKGLCSHKTIQPVLIGYCNLMTYRMRDKCAALTFLSVTGIPVPSTMPQAPACRRSSRLALQQAQAKVK